MKLMNINISEMLETFNECFNEMKNDVDATNDMIIDDLLIALGYNKKRNKNVRRMRNSKINWAIVTPTGKQIAIKVYAIGSTMDDKSRLETVEACENGKISVLLITNGEFIDVLRFVEQKSSFEEICNIHITDELGDREDKILTAISADGYDESILDSFLPKEEMTVEKLTDILKNNESDLKAAVIKWANIDEHSLKKFDELWGKFYKDFVKKISVSNVVDNSLASEMKQKDKMITELEDKIKGLNTQIELKDREISALQTEIEESTVNVHKRALEMLDLIASSNDGTRNYVALINDEIVQYDSLHKFVGRVLQQLYKIKSFEAQSFIFNGNIFRLSAKNVKYNDIIINNKAYDILISDDEEDDALLKLGTLFSKFSDITFVCKKLGTRETHQATGISEDALDNSEELLISEVEAADKITATSGNKISHENDANTSNINKEKQSTKTPDVMVKNQSTVHENDTASDSTSDENDGQSENNKLSNKLSLLNKTSDTNSDTNETNDELSEKSESSKNGEHHDNYTHIDSEDDKQLIKNSDVMVKNQSTVHENDDHKSESDSGVESSDSESLKNKNDDNCADNDESKNKENDNCDTSGEQTDEKDGTQSNSESDAYGNEEKTNDDLDIDDIDLGFDEFENITETIDDTSGEDIVAEEHDKIVNEITKAEDELSADITDDQDENAFDFDEELDAELSDSELDRFMKDDSDGEESDDDEDFDPFHIIDNEPELDITNTSEDNDDSDEDEDDEEDDIEELLEDEEDEESEDEDDEESDEDDEEDNDDDTSVIDDIGFADIGTDLVGNADIKSESDTEQEEIDEDKIEKTAEKVAEILEQKKAEAHIKSEGITEDEEPEPVLNQFEPEMETDETEVINSAKANESDDTEENEVDTTESEDTESHDDSDIVVEKQEAVISEIGTGGSLSDETDDYESYFAEQQDLGISIGRDDDTDEDDTDDEEEDDIAEEKPSISQDNGTDDSNSANDEVENGTDDNSESAEEEYDDNSVLLVAQMQNVDKLMYTDDDVKFYNIKYIGSNDVTYLVNAGDDETMTYEKLLCKCIQAVVAIQEYNGDDLIITKLRQKDLTGINEHIKHKSAEYRDYPALKVAPFVVAGVKNIKDVALAVLDLCKGMEIDMTQMFMYIEASTQSDYIIENYGYDEESVQLRDTEMYTPNENGTINEKLAVLTGNMFNRVIVSENSLRVHKDVILSTLAVKTKYLERSLSDQSEFASIAEDMLNWAAHNNMEINFAKIGPVLGKNYKIASSDSSEVGPNNTQIDVRGHKVYVTNVENWQIPTALIKMHTAITNNTSIAIRVRINADAVNYYGREYDTSEPSASLAITSYVNYVASCVKQVKR